MRIFGQNIDMVKQLLVHEATIALRMARRQSDIFIQIIAAGLFEAHAAFLIKLYQLLVHPDRRTARSKA
ncbi:hypothetical protein D3C81_1591740 [compost metagenome]